MGRGTSTGAPKTVLVVEDDESIAMGLEMNLSAEGYRVLVAGDGEEGLGRPRGVRVPRPLGEDAANEGAVGVAYLDPEGVGAVEGPQGIDDPASLARLHAQIPRILSER